ncbi:MAG: integrase arm-type DNA-binding domain-containing protein [Burkholderiaceae bacterium]|jgi:integrase|nr:integrase arm-type DNA-binding domain-containing protein [Burkholderiaceae bacterium]
MPKLVKPLSDAQIRNAKGKGKPYKLADGGGMYLTIQPHGAKLWRMDYTFGGNRKTLSFGAYPAVSLEQARKRRDEAKKLLAADIDPSDVKKAQKQAKLERAANSFEVVAREWLERRKAVIAGRTATHTLAFLEKWVFPFIGDKPIADMKASDFLAVLRRVESQGKIDTAHRIRGYCSQVMRYAVATERAESDPLIALTGAIQPRNVAHRAAITEPKQAAELLRMIDGYSGTFVVACALKIAPYVFVRPGELRAMRWQDIDLDTAEWRYAVTKTKTEHIVPLAKQVISILKEIHPVTGHGKYVFPSPRTGERPMSDNAVLSAFRRMGITKEEMTGHGFRAMARTILDEVLGERVDLIEHQLAHAVRDPLGRAYNRTSHLPERKRMMQRWADYLDELRDGGPITHENR